jgi:iron complex outermembrane receptor protein
MRDCMTHSFLSSILLLMLGGLAAAGQRTATLSGVAIAADGARLPGVVLILVNPDTGATMEAVSSDAGVFVIGNLPPGRYQLEATLSGFEPCRVTGIALSAGASLTLEVRLDVATLRETVQVVGTAAGLSVEAFEMRESRARDLGEALAAVPGLVKVRKGGVANDLVVRGLQGKDLTVLIDGQRLDGACPGKMDPPAFHVDFAEVTRVEISRGPFDVKNQGGLGGTVNVVTERPQRGWHGSANATLASAGTRAASASMSVGGGRLALLGGASVRRADAYRDGSGTPLTARTGYRAERTAGLPAYDVWTGWGRLAFVPRAGSSLQVSYTRQDADAMLVPYLQMDALFDNADRAGARFEVADLPGGWGALAAHAYFTRVDHWMTDELRNTSLGRPRPYSMATRANTSIGGGRAEVERGALSLGIEASRRTWDTRTLLAMLDYAPQAPLPDVTIEVAGAFAAWSAAPSRRWTLETGARLDRAVTTADPGLADTDLYLAYHGTTTTRATDVLPTAYGRARWRPDAGWSATASLGHSARLPDQQERFYALRRAGSDWVGNPALSPARNTGFDGELRYGGHGVDLALSAFVYRIDAAILIADRPRLRTVAGAANAAARSYINHDALMRGFEASATVPLAPALFLSADASWVRGTTRGRTAGAPRADVAPLSPHLPEIPPLRGRLRLRFDNARWHGLAEVAASARQDRVAGGLGEAPTPAFAVLNLRGGLRAGPLAITAGIDNVLDALYAEHLSYQRDPFRSGVRIYEPGRTLSVTAGGRF